jgi:hypothetical protein
MEHQGAGQQGRFSRGWTPEVGARGSKAFHVQDHRGISSGASTAGSFHRGLVQGHFFRVMENGSISLGFRTTGGFHQSARNRGVSLRV